MSSKAPSTLRSRTDPPASTSLSRTDPPASARPLGFWLLALVTALLLVRAILLIVAAPVELQMGIVQKIFYFHVPSAWAMYVGFSISVVGSAVYLAKRNEAWEAAAVAGAEVGAVFSAVVMVTGPLWAYKSWGTGWTWDPRLTTMLLTAMIYVAYLLLRNLGASGEVERRFAAGLALLGGALMPIIHYSVQLWRGQHPTVITQKGGGLHPDMRMALWWSGLAFLALASLLIWARTRAERDRQRVQLLELEVEEFFTEEPA
jgi:heme exporter protein C